MNNDEPLTVSDTNSALFNNCLLVFNAMHEAGTHRHEGLVWEGKLTNLLVSLDISLGQYTPVVGRLKRMDCIRQIRRGGGGSNSLWILTSHPTLEAFNETKEAKASSADGQGSIHSNGNATDAMITALNVRIQTLEHQVGILIEDKVRRDQA